MKAAPKPKADRGLEALLIVGIATTVLVGGFGLWWFIYGPAQNTPKPVREMAEAEADEEIEEDEDAQPIVQASKRPSRPRPVQPQPSEEPEGPLVDPGIDSDDPEIQEFATNSTEFESMLATFEQEMEAGSSQTELSEQFQTALTDRLGRLPFSGGRSTAKCSKSICELTFESERPLAYLIADIAPELKAYEGLASGEPRTPNDLDKLGNLQEGEAQPTLGVRFFVPAEQVQARLESEDFLAPLERPSNLPEHLLAAPTETKDDPIDAPAEPGDGTSHNGDTEPESL